MASDSENSAASRQHFETKASEYEKASGGSTSSIAMHLATLAGDITEDSHILDLAAGPGVVLDALMECENTKSYARSARYTVVEPATSMLDIVRFKAFSKWPIDQDRISIHNLSAEDLADTALFPNGTFTHVFCNFGFMFFPDPESAARNIHRVLKSGGKALISTFTHVGYWPAFERAVSMIRPNGPAFQPPFPMAWTDQSHLGTVMRAGPFGNVQSLVVQCKMHLPSLEELATNTTRRFEELFRDQGWTEAELDMFRSEVMVKLAEDQANVVLTEDGVQVKMVASIAICEKDS